MIELKENFNLKQIHCYTSNSLFSYRVVGNLTQKLKKKILCPLVTIPTVYLWHISINAFFLGGGSFKLPLIKFFFFSIKQNILTIYIVEIGCAKILQLKFLAVNYSNGY